ncbi:MAG: GNAT family N-acetyltransferase [Thermomicrobiales bacterium]
MGVLPISPCERFAPDRHNWRKFRCPNPTFDVYLRRARKETEHSPAVIYVLNDAAAKRIIGYYSISSTSIARQSFPDEFRGDLQPYAEQPAMLIGRLAVDRDYLGKGYGGNLLIDACRRCLALREHVGFVAVMVDAIDADAARFYRHHEFIPFPSAPDKLFIPIATITKLSSI